MSQETMQWFDDNALIGFTEKRGDAWWKRYATGIDSNGEANHYTGEIPVEDVQRRLFNWTADETPLYVPGTGATDGGFVPVPGRKAIRRSDTGRILGIFKDGYRGHDYNEWLIKLVADFLGDSVSIGSACLLREGARAFVQVEVPETIDTPEGVKFRPFIGAATSFDGSLATTYKRGCTIWVCDNTMAAGLAEDGGEYKVRHSRYSGAKIQDAKDALGLIHSIADEFSAQVAEWCAVKVTGHEFDRVLDAIIPVPEDDGRGKTRAQNRQADVRSLYNGDARVAPWSGTKFGVVQAFNTYLHHVATQKGGVARAERNLDNALSGKIDAHDAHVLTALDAVLA
jgi:phage/plasmid-like protein (TIGR03299 family)